MAYQTPINPTVHGHLYRSLGKTIRYYRKKMGLSQAKLADAIGSKSPDYISKLERQKKLTQPSLEFLFVLADIFFERFITTFLEFPDILEHTHKFTVSRHITLSETLTYTAHNHYLSYQNSRKKPT